MSDTAIQDDVAAYLAEVREALADLPADERAEVLAELEGHLHEVAAEDGSLTDLLGSPQAYADELRASAGLPPRAPAVPPRTPLRDRLRDPALRRAALEFANQLRPAWWLIRAYALVRLLGAATGTPLDSTLVPKIYGATVLGVLTFVVLAVCSVLLGQQRLRGPARWVVWAVNAVLAWTCLAVLWTAAHRVQQISEPPPEPYPGLTSGYSGPITNIYPYDSKGHLLKDVYLYDQNGIPLQVDPYNSAENLYPLSPAQIVVTLNGDGRTGVQFKTVPPPSVPIPPALRRSQASDQRG